MTRSGGDPAVLRRAIQSPVGWIEIGVVDGFVAECRFADRKPKSSGSRSRDKTMRAAVNALARYFDGDFAPLSAVPILVKGTEFRRAVWQELRAIPAGRPISYGDVAARVGSAGASRAVGSACGANQICLFVPCHRVIASGGGLGGFSGGLWRKQALLALETP